MLFWHLTLVSSNELFTAQAYKNVLQQDGVIVQLCASVGYAKASITCAVKFIFVLVVVVLFRDMVPWHIWHQDTFTP